MTRFPLPHGAVNLIVKTDARKHCSSSICIFPATAISTKLWTSPSSTNNIRGAKMPHTYQVFRVWVWELLTLALSLGLIIAIAVILAKYDGKPTTHWNAIINFNALLAFLSTHASKYVGYYRLPRLSLSESGIGCVERAVICQIYNDLTLAAAAAMGHCC